MNTRNWSIRSKIVALVTAPIAALLTLWIFATTLTLGPALSLLDAQTLLDKIGRPGEALVAELQHERRLSLIYLAGRADDGGLGAQRKRTDEAVAAFRRSAGSKELRDSASPLLRRRLDQMFTALDILPAGRGFIDRREMDKSRALGLYSGTIDSAFRAFAVMIDLPDNDVNRDARTLTALGRAREVLAQSDALLAGVFTAGRFAQGEHGQLLQIIGTKRFLYVSAVADLSDADRAAYQRLTEGDAFVQLREMEDKVIAQDRTDAKPGIDAAAWQSAYEPAQQQLREFELSASDALAERTKPLALGILVRLGLAGVLGLAAVIISVVIALRVGRSLIRRLTGLRAAALELAGHRLPAVVGRLRRSEDVDVAAEAPPLEYGADEIGQVGHAFNEVQLTAVQSAVDEAGLRRGLSEVFLNIARRNQTLVHRQLALLDKMERRTTDPEELADLFRMDHMATRMRRHADDLVILAGAAPGRGWRNPVPMIDIVRGAVSEVEDYARVNITFVETSAVAGRAVGDIIHLLAELIENATAFSPPHTKVHIVGQAVPNGYAIEIEDRGLGMTPEAIDEANRRFADPPDFDPANSARLGLFVVAQLGARHGVKVRLRPSPYGGVTAVALVPTDLVVAAATRALPGRPPDLADVPAGPGPGTVDATAARRDGEPTAEPSPTGRVLVAAEPPAHPSADHRRIRAVPHLTPAPAQDAPVPSVRPTPDPVPAARPARAATPRKARVGDDGLPRRIRQTSLAPQLREQAVPVGDRASSVEPAPRSPEEVRARMSALQAGTARGRQEAAHTKTDAAVPARVAGTPPAGAAPATPTGRLDTDGESADQERDA